MGSGDITKEYDPLDRILSELSALRSEVNGLANKIASVETRLGSVETRLGSVETRLSTLEDRVEKKLLETKPVWVAELNNRIDGLEAKLEAKIDSLRGEMQKGFNAVTDRMDEMAIDISKIRGAQRGFDQRLRTLELEREQRQQV